MGLMDRDYMHERHRQSNGSKGSHKQPIKGPHADRSKWMILWWTVGVCSAIFLGVKYLVLPFGGLPFPQTGQVLWYISDPDSDVAPLTIKAPIRGDEMHAVRINEAGSGRLIGLVPLHKGESVKVGVPLGVYDFTFASGKVWLGPEKLFGFTGKRKKTTDPLHFYRTGNQIIGHTIDLTQRTDGNMPTRAISLFEK